MGSGTLTVKQSITTSFLGDISGSGGLTKAGPGTLILDGTNDYTGLTSVNNGVLEIGDADHPEASLLGPVTIGVGGQARRAMAPSAAMSPIPPAACSRPAAASAR